MKKSCLPMKTMCHLHKDGKKSKLQFKIHVWYYWGKEDVLMGWWLHYGRSIYFSYLEHAAKISPRIVIQAPGLTNTEEHM